MRQKLIHKGNVIIITNSITKIIIINAIQTITATIFPPQHSSTITLTMATNSSSSSSSSLFNIPHHHHHLHYRHEHLYLIIIIIIIVIIIITLIIIIIIFIFITIIIIITFIFTFIVTISPYNVTKKVFSILRNRKPTNVKKSLTFKPNLLTHLLHLLPGRFFL